jgi:hypothetical protein
MPRWRSWLSTMVKRSVANGCEPLPFMRHFFRLRM